MRTISFFFLTMSMMAALAFRPQVAPKSSVLLSGKITHLGTPIIGCSVSIKGTKEQTFTDASGKFNLESISEQGQIVIQKNGYAPVEIAFSGESLNILIQLSSLSLESEVAHLMDDRGRHRSLNNQAVLCLPGQKPGPASNTER